MGLLALDVGNTRIKWAWYANSSTDRKQQPVNAHPTASTDAFTAIPQVTQITQATPLLPLSPLLPQAQGVEFLENIHTLAEGVWQTLPIPEQIIGCIVAGDAAKRAVREQLELWDTPVSWVVPKAEQCGVHNGYDHPSRLGADRWVAMIGARQRLLRAMESTPPLPPLVLVMAGTAVTVDAIDPSGRFLGGVILPGHGIMMKALLSGTAGLHVPTGEVQNFPTNTSDALTSGGAYAITGAIYRMKENLWKHCQQEPLCYMTGGAAWKIAPYMQDVAIEVIDNLIFDGLLEIAQTQQKPQLADAALALY